MSYGKSDDGFGFCANLYDIKLCEYEATICAVLQGERVDTDKIAQYITSLKGGQKKIAKVWPEAYTSEDIKYASR